MPRKKTPSRVSPRALAWLAASALALFAIGEAYSFSRSDSGQLILARHLGLGDPAQVTRILGRRVRMALDRAGVPPDSVTERARGERVAWRIGLTSDASILQVNYAVTRALEVAGASVLSGQETWAAGRPPTLLLRVGLPMRATHELQFVRLPREGPSLPEPGARLAIVLYGFGEDPAAADSSFTLPVPFGVALAPGRRTSRDLFRAAHARGREVVLHLPLEPINYPRVNPGPGTLLVTMSPARITEELRRDLDQARPVAAVANHMGSLATQDMTFMRAVYHELRRGDVPFVHVMPAAGAVCRSLATELGVGYTEPDAVLDDEPRSSDAGRLDRRWKEILKRARERRGSMVWIRATPLVRRWLPLATSTKRLEGVSLVPLSALIRKPPPI